VYVCGRSVSTFFCSNMSKLGIEHQPMRDGGGSNSRRHEIVSAGSSLAWENDELIGSQPLEVPFGHHCRYPSSLNVVVDDSGADLIARSRSATRSQVTGEEIPSGNQLSHSLLIGGSFWMLLPKATETEEDLRMLVPSAEELRNSWWLGTTHRHRAHIMEGNDVSQVLLVPCHLLPSLMERWCRPPWWRWPLVAQDLA
jgi:hypothetical protein